MFTIHISDQGFVFRVYKALWEINKKDQSTQPKWTNILNKYFTRENIQLIKAQEKVVNTIYESSDQIRSDQSLSCVRLFATPWITARQASLSITNSRSSLRLMSIESMMPSSRLILCCPLLLLPPIPPSIRVFSNESTLCMRWPKYWSWSYGDSN